MKKWYIYHVSLSLSLPVAREININNVNNDKSDSQARCVGTTGC